MGTLQNRDHSTCIRVTTGNMKCILILSLLLLNVSLIDACLGGHLDPTSNHSRWRRMIDTVPVDGLRVMALETVRWIQFRVDGVGLLGLEAVWITRYQVEILLAEYYGNKGLTAIDTPKSFTNQNIIKNRQEA